MQKTRIAVSRVVLGLMLGAAYTSGASAQAPAKGQPSAEEAQSSDGLQEIIVTARRREESLQSVPVAVTALDGEALRDANITRMENLGNVAPALVVTPSQSRSNTPAFAIRGQRQDAGYISNDPSVGIYVAEAVQARVFGLAQSLYDLESVQVLKGPQGTLFGRNTTGGAILFQPTRPELGETTGYVQARYGNYDRFDLQGAVTLPIGETLAVRLAYNRTRRDGYMTNVISGAKLNAEHTDGGRATVLFKPTDDISNTLYVDYFKADATATALKTTQVNPAGLANTRFGLAAIFARQTATLGFYEVEGEFTPRSKGSNFGITNVTVLEPSDSITIKNIANFRRIRSSETQEFDGAAPPVLTADSDQNSNQYSDELQLQANALDDRLQLIAGLYYFRENADMRIEVASLGAPPTERFGQARNTSYSVFAQGDYKVTDSLTATLGARMTWDRRALAIQLYNAAGVCTFCASAAKNFSAPTFTGTLSWQIDSRRMVYVTTRRGYRAGGYNASATTPNAFLPFEPEKVTDYEVGFKGDWRFGDAALRTNLALYHTDYTEIQRSIILPVNNSPTTSIFNAASAKIDGGEFEVQFLPTSVLELFGSVAYVKPKYTEFEFAAVTGGGIVDQSGNTFAWIPRWSYRVGATTHIPVGDESELKATVDYTWQSHIYFGEFNSPLAAQDAYGLLNARVELSDIGGSGITVAAWGRNLAGRKYYSASGDQYSGLGLVYSALGEPRTYGIEVAFRF